MTTERRIVPQRILLHAVFPLAAPAALVALYFTPKSTFGCANRGLMALAVVFLGVIGAVFATVKSTMAKRKGDAEAANWWFLTTLLLASPLFLLIGPLR